MEEISVISKILGQNPLVKSEIISWRRVVEDKRQMLIAGILPNVTGSKPTLDYFQAERYRCLEKALGTAEQSCDMRDQNGREAALDKVRKKLMAIEWAGLAQWMLETNLNPSWTTIMGDDKKCYYCGEDFTKSLNQLLLFTRDHLIPESVGGLSTESNLVPSCTICNSIKGNYTPLDRNKWIKDEEFRKDVRKEVKERREALEEKYENLIQDGKVKSVLMIVSTDPAAQGNELNEEGITHLPLTFERNG